MAELQTPSAAAVFDATSQEKKKPERPDETEFQTNLKKAEKEHAEAQKKFNDARAKVDVAQPKGKDSPAAKRRQELISQLNEIKKEQQGGKSGRTQVFDQIKKLDEQLKSRIAEQKLAKSKTNFKDVAELDTQIANLDKQVNAGSMKLVDEKKALAEISNLRKQRKNFSGLDDAQKGIDDVKAKLKNLRDSLDDPASKALSEKYSTIQAELDTIKAEQDEAYKNINALRDDREKAYNLQQEKYLSIKGIKDAYYQGKKAFQQYEYEARQRARERQKTEREAFDREKKKERAEKMLDEAKDPAYLDEIRKAESVLRYFDPSTKTANAPLLAPSGLTASAQRQVDDAGFKGTRLVKKDQDDFFVGTGGKKGKKSRKTAESPAAASPASTTAKFNCPPSVMEDCSSMGIEPPYNAADVPAVVEKIKEKITFWKADQKAQTERNMTKAKKEIERIEAEETAATGTSTQATNGQSATNGTVGGIIAAAQSAVASAAEVVSDTVAEVTEGVKAMAAGENKE